MPKYVKTIVKKSSIVPWMTDILTENSDFLTEEEKTIRQLAASEHANYSGFVNYDVIKIGNTQIISFEFDTLENLNNFVNRTQDASHPSYEANSNLALNSKLFASKVKELGLADSYTITSSKET